MRGNAPNDCETKLVGCQFVPKKNSKGDTEPKKGNPWLRRYAKIRMTTNMENKAQARRAFSVSFSESHCLVFCLSAVFSIAVSRFRYQKTIENVGSMFPVLWLICNPL